MMDGKWFLKTRVLIQQGSHPAAIELMDGKGFLKSRAGFPSGGVRGDGWEGLPEIKGSHPVGFPSGGGRSDGWEGVLEIKGSHPAGLPSGAGQGDGWKGFLGFPSGRGSHPAVFER